STNKFVLIALEREDRADFGADVRRFHYVGDDRHGVCAGRESFRDPRFGDPADRDDWNPYGGAYRAKIVETDPGGDVLQSAGIHRSESDVVRAAIFGRARLLEVVSRDSNYLVFAGTGDSPRRLEREILLPKMHSVRFGENRDIDPIVDD